MAHLPLLKRPEQFLVIDLAPERVQALLLGVDENRTIHVRHRWHDFEWIRWARRLKPYPFLPSVAVAADPSLVFTRILPLQLVRSQPSAPLTAVELENSLSQILGGVLNEYRPKAARQLGIDEVHAILVNARVSDLTIDGRELVYPVGHACAKIQGFLEITFTRRDIFEHWKGFFNARRPFFFTDAVASQLALLRRVLPQPIRLLRATEAGAALFTFDAQAPRYILKKEALSWSTQDLVLGIRHEWGIAEAPAQQLYEAYRRGEMSPRMAASLESLARPGMNNLLRQLHALNIKDNVHVSSPLPLYKFVQAQRRPLVPLQPPPLKEALRAMGFAMARNDVGDDTLFVNLAVFLEFYYDKYESHVNQWFKSRLHWLTP